MILKLSYKTYINKHVHMYMSFVETINHFLLVYKLYCQIINKIVMSHCDSTAYNNNHMFY